MIAELPDTAARKVFVIIGKLEIIVNVARRHGADVFAHEERLMIFGIVEIVFNIAHACIHSAFNVGNIAEIFTLGNGRKLLVAVLVVDYSVSVTFSYVLSHCTVVDSDAALVAERPHDNAGRVLVPFVEQSCTVNVGFLPFGNC